jgi:GNAT superfamily N-acetyltransferase
MPSTSALRILPATENDIPLILEFIRDLAIYERHHDRLEATEERLRQTLFSREPAASVILAFDGNNPVGFAVFYFTYSTFVALPGLYLEDLFVRPEARGLGIGKQILSYLARLAIDKGCWRIEWAVLHWNQSAIGFYQNLGAVAMDEWSVYRLFGKPLDQLAGV